MKKSILVVSAIMVSLLSISLALFTTLKHENSLIEPSVVVSVFMILIGSFAIQFASSRMQWLGAVALLTITIPIILSGFWFSAERWGISDWDTYFSRHENLRNTMLHYHQFPFWNPYTCGGTAGLGDPEFPGFTITFLLELLFGINPGLRLSIYLVTVVGAVGVLMLAKSIRLSVVPALLAALTYALSSVNLLEIVEGHVNIFAAMWIPWIFWSWLKAYRHQARPLLCGIFLALTFYQGGIYLLMYTTLAFAVLPFLVRQPGTALAVTIKAALWGMGLAGLKLIPVLYWLQTFPDETYAGSASTVRYLHYILLGRYLHGAGDLIPNQNSAWHEYGAYIGPVLSLFAAVGVFFMPASRLKRGLMIAVILTVLVSSAGPLLKPLFDQASFLPRSNISRLILFAVLPLGLLAAFGLEYFSHSLSLRYRRLLVTVIVVLVTLDLGSLAYQLSQQAFVIPPQVPAPKPAPAPIAFTTQTFKFRSHDTEHNRSYAATLAGYGTLDYCSVLGPHPNVRTIHDEGSGPISSFHDHEGKVDRVEWSPNKIEVWGEAYKDANLILNTNFAPGWRANGQPAKEVENLVASHTSAGPFHTVFTYHTPGWWPGLSLTGLTAMLAIVFYPLGFYRRLHKDASHP